MEGREAHLVLVDVVDAQGVQDALGVFCGLWTFFYSFDDLCSRLPSLAWLI